MQNTMEKMNIIQSGLNTAFWRRLFTVDQDIKFLGWLPLSPLKTTNATCSQEDKARTYYFLDYQIYWFSHSCCCLSLPDVLWDQPTHTLHCSVWFTRFGCMHHWVRRDGLISAQVTTSSPRPKARAWCGDLCWDQPISPSQRCRMYIFRSSSSRLLSALPEKYETSAQCRSNAGPFLGRRPSIKPTRGQQKFFFNLKFIINVLVITLSASFEYLCYGSTAIIN